MRSNVFSKSVKPLRLLILGGTGFIGPHYVRAAVGRGHQVTVFNRGKSNIEFPGEVERLVGDRNGDLQALVGREWDAVVDLATFGPVWVRNLGKVLSGHVNHYTFISTCSVYDKSAITGEITEQNPLVAYQGKEDPYSLTGIGQHYGALKVLCEQEAEQQFPGRALILRPGYIVGPGDPNGAFTYWAARMALGGEVLVVGDRSTQVQFIDVRDLAEWNLHMIETNQKGIHNVVGPASRMDFGELIDAARGFASPSARLTWASSAWLAARQDREDPMRWWKLLFWTFDPMGWAWSMRMNIERALACGLTFRPAITTLTDTFQWYQSLSAERKLHVTRAPGDTMCGWSDYLRFESDALKDWHAAKPN